MNVPIVKVMFIKYELNNLKCLLDLSYFLFLILSSVLSIFQFVFAIRVELLITVLHGIKIFS